MHSQEIRRFLFTVDIDTGSVGDEAQQFFFSHIHLHEKHELTSF